MDDRGKQIAHNALWTLCPLWLYSSSAMPAFQVIVRDNLFRRVGCDPLRRSENFSFSNIEIFFII